MCKENELYVNFTQIPTQTKIFLKNMVEKNLLKIKIKVLKHFWNESWKRCLKKSFNEVKKMIKRKPEDIIKVKRKENRSWTKFEINLFDRALPDPDEGFIDTFEKKVLEKEAKSKVFVIVTGSLQINNKYEDEYKYILL